MAFQVEEGGLPYCLWDNIELGVKEAGAESTSKGRIRGVTDRGPSVENQGPPQLCWLGCLHRVPQPGSGPCREGLRKKAEKRSPIRVRPTPAHSLDRHLSFILSVS